KDPNSIAGLAGDRAPNEDLYLFGRFFREVLGSQNYNSTVEADDLNASVGLSAGSDISQLGKGSVIFVMGSDVEEEAPVTFLRMRQAAARGARLIVANGRPATLDRHVTAPRSRYSY